MRPHGGRAALQKYATSCEALGRLPMQGLEQHLEKPRSGTQRSAADRDLPSDMAPARTPAERGGPA